MGKVSNPARSIKSRGSFLSILSMYSFASILSIGSTGSILSFYSVASILSIGSEGGVLRHSRGARPSERRTAHG